MIILLGVNSEVESYAKQVMGLNVKTDLVCYPGNLTHYTEYGDLIENIEKDNPTAITSQNAEFIDLLLGSDLDLEVRNVTNWTKGNISIYDKNEAILMSRYMGYDLR
jgi:hypothetical protein